MWLKQFLARMGREGLLRLVADVILINLAVLASLAVRLLYIVAYGNPTAGINYRQTFWDYLSAYWQNSWLLTLICLIIFTLSGFYTYGRFYRSRYKAVAIFQAVSVAYLIFGLLTYLAQGLVLPFLKDTLNFPRGALLLAWGLTVSLLLLARGWSWAWKGMTRSERKKQEDETTSGPVRVLVIGGAGYIGSALLPLLLDKGYHVRLLDLLLYGEEPIQQWLGHPNLEVMQADFRQIDRVVEAMQGVHSVIHLGGLVGDPACAVDEALTIDINVMATRMIAEVAKGSGVDRFIFASTCSVYGASSQILDERSQLNPVSLYARSKIASEQVLLKMADEHFSPVLLRFGTIFGLSGRTRFDLVINLLTAKAVVEGEITLFGGDQWRPFVHVADAGEALLTVLEAPLELVRSQVFNIGSSDHNYTIRQVGEKIQKLVPTASLVSKGEDVDKRNYWVSFNKVRSTLGFVPKWTVEEGVLQVIGAIQSGKVSDYRDARYSNVKFLTEEGISLLVHNEIRWAYQLVDEAG